MAKAGNSDLKSLFFIVQLFFPGCTKIIGNTVEGLHVACALEFVDGTGSFHLFGAINTDIPCAGREGFQAERLFGSALDQQVICIRFPGKAFLAQRQAEVGS